VRRILFLAAVAAMLLALTAAPALAKARDTGCADFGEAISNFAQQNQGQSVAIDRFGNLKPPKGGVDQNIHRGQARFCD
jgi:hypothetical protein